MSSLLMSVSASEYPALKQAPASLLKSIGSDDLVVRISGQEGLLPTFNLGLGIRRSVEYWNSFNERKEHNTRYAKGVEVYGTQGSRNKGESGLRD